MIPHYDRCFIKLVRDKTRTRLIKSSKCWVTGETQGLEIHHMYTLSTLVNTYLKDNNISITDANKLLMREKFILANKDAVQEQVVLKKSMHKKLHCVFGLKYPNHVVPKIRIWLDIQKVKHEQLVR